MHRIYSYLFFVCATVAGLSIVFLNKNLIPLIPTILFCSLVYLSFVVYEIFSRFFLLRTSIRGKIGSLNRLSTQPWISNSLNAISWLVFLGILTLLLVGSLYGLGIFFMKNFGVDMLTSLSAPQESISSINDGVDKLIIESSKNSQTLNYLMESTFSDKFLAKNSQKYTSNTTQSGVYATMLFDKVEYRESSVPRVYAVYKMDFINPSSPNVPVSGRNNYHALSFNVSDIIKQVRLLSYYPKSLKGLPIFLLTVVLGESQNVTVYYPKSINISLSALDVNNDYSTDIPVNGIEYRDLEDGGFSLTFETTGIKYTNLYILDSYGNVTVTD